MFSECQELRGRLSVMQQEVINSKKEFANLLQEKENSSGEKSQEMLELRRQNDELHLQLESIMGTESRLEGANVDLARTKNDLSEVIFFF